MGLNGLELQPEPSPALAFGPGAGNRHSQGAGPLPAAMGGWGEAGFQFGDRRREELDG